MTMAYVDKTKPQEQEGWLMNCKLTSSKRSSPHPLGGRHISLLLQ